MTVEEQRELELLLGRATGVQCLLTSKQRQRLKELLSKNKELTNDNKTTTYQR